MEQFIDLLGHKAQDKVTGRKGVITSVSFDLYGCCQIWISPQVGADGTRADGMWYDVSRAKITGKTKVMEADFTAITTKDPLIRATKVKAGTKGPDDKGAPRQ